MSVIKNYELMTDKLNALGSWSYEGIVGIEYDIDIDGMDGLTTTLELTFFVSLSLIKSNRRFKLKIRYYNVSDLTLRKVTNLYLTDNLIIHDKNEIGWESSKRYHVHDDSGYGENDGFNFIDFYCSSIEAVSVEDFYK
ncbi:hypothetical protein K0T92_15165 [Paenibacillus oenotherae]|uniref:Immunity protein 50 of polymorphic toxin system n=1 Tax=Paenibacillus oenotherae TaxID=1435645 RepID=A0ABS7D823_9BACL|nr:hypothetical protein [Paenibacillus oenotherae]MBW7476084.1 hypothetical protein [Paenibacillus oenotherae]